MALSEEAKARGFSQALGHIGASRIKLAAQGRPDDAVNAGNLARKLYDANRNTTGATYSSYAAVARRAIRAEELAREMNANPSRAPSRAELPEVPTLYSGDERYRYYIAVTYSGIGGRTATVRGEVVSDVPLSGAEVEARVRQRLDYSDSPGRSTRRAMRRLGAAPQFVEAEILAATRVY